MRRPNAGFAYPTPKIARIEDSRLGLLRYALMCLIFLYVVGYQIMWRGNHLETQDLAGVYQLQLDHPTKNNCDPINVECMQNFSSLSTLPYCAQSPEAGSIKMPCQYWDAQQLGQLTDQGLMIPTHISTFYQTAGCTPTVANNWTCVGWLYDFLDKKGKVQKTRGKASPIEDIFVADIERYTLIIDHSVRSTLGHRYYASEMVGYVLDCNQQDDADTGCVPKPITCQSDDCKGQLKSLPETRSLEKHPRFRGDRRSLVLAAEKKDDRPQRPRGIKRPRSRDLAGSQALAPDSPPADEEADATSALQLERGDEILQTLSQQDPEADPRSEISEASELPDEAAKATPLEVAPARAGDLDSLGVVSLAQGDMFNIGMLLKAANMSLDQRRHHVPSWVGGSYRSSGFVLVIRVHYTNIESWLGMKVLPWKITGPTMHYTYRITKHASHEDFMLRSVHPGGPNDPKNSRVVKEYHGIKVLIEQSGSVAVWDNIQLLLILTTTLALMAVSNCITDTVALYCMPKSDEYWAIKFETPRKKASAKKGRKSPRAADGDGDEDATDEESLEPAVITHESRAA